MERSARSAELVATSALTLGAIALLIHNASSLAWPMVDDAGIALSYGRTFFEGFGFRLTPNSQVAEGATSPMFSLLQGLGTWLGAEPVRWSQNLGLTFGALALVFCALIPSVLQGRWPQVQDALGPLLAAACPPFAAWCDAGLETGLWACALVGSVLAMHLLAERAKPVLAGVWCASLWLIRPEAPLACVVLLALFAWSLRANRLASLLRFMGAAALTAGAIVATRWLIFADVVPNTYHVKVAWGTEGNPYLQTFVEAHGWLMKMAAVGLVLGLVFKATRRTAFPLLGLVIAVSLFAWRATDWMPEFRFFAPAIPLLAAGAALTVGVARRLEQRVLRGLAMVAGVLLLAQTGRMLWSRHATTKQNQPFPFSFVRNQTKNLQSQLAPYGFKRPLLAVADIGGASFEWPEAEWIDAAGLCDKSLALSTNDLEMIEDYLAFEGPPTLLDVHGPSGNAGRPKVLAQMESAGGPFYRARGLTPAEDSRCPDGKAAALSTSAAQLVLSLQADLDAGEAVRALRRWRCAFSYADEANLPTMKERRALAERAMKRSNELEATQLESALRHASFATIISGHDPHLRRKTEALRRRFIHKPAP